jgi:hypothetical protein
MTHTDIAMTVLSFAVVKTSNDPLWTGIHIWARKATHWWRECVFVAIASALDCIPIVRYKMRHQPRVRVLLGATRSGSRAGHRVPLLI